MSSHRTPSGNRFGATAEDGPGDGSRLWPIAIAIGLLLVVLVNLAFIYIAVSGADEITPSYFTEPR